MVFLIAVLLIAVLLIAVLLIAVLLATVGGRRPPAAPGIPREQMALDGTAGFRSRTIFVESWWWNSRRAPATLA
jgi:hypothetical protein